LVALTLKLPGQWANLMALGFALLFWASLSFIAETLVYAQALFGLAIWVAIFLWMPRYRYSGRWSRAINLLVFLLGVDLLWICGHGLVYLQAQQGGWLLLYLFTLVWVADIGAYFSGRRYGRHKLAARISPGKTWEGVAGGILANLIWMLAVFWLSGGWGFGLIEFMLIGLGTSVLSVVGDLFESILKREAGVKDSGRLLPGHGGILDRIDSVIAASPVFVAGLVLTGNL